MKKILIIIITLGIFSPSGFAGIKWNSFNQAMSLAKKQKKFVMVDFYADWCKYCKVMEKQTFLNPKVKKMLDAYFILAKIDTEKTNENIYYEGSNYSTQEFLGSLRMQGLPTVGFLDKKGQFITLIPGFIPPETFLNILKYIKDECHTKKVPFKEYVGGSATCPVKK